MTHVKLELREQVAHIFLDRGKSNALDLEMVIELRETLDLVGGDGRIGGVMIHGKEGIFSSGLDLEALYHYDESQIVQFWTQFLDLVGLLVAYDKPTIAVINGHSPAAGCVLALCCDYRIMATGKFVIGLNEIPVGLMVSHAIFELYSFWLGRAKAYRFLLTGTLLTPEEAWKEGLVEEVLPANQLDRQAERQMRKYLDLNWTVWRRSKLEFRKQLIDHCRQDHHAFVGELSEQWWHPANRAMLKVVIQNLGS